jgi:putative flippase GtrA
VLTELIKKYKNFLVQFLRFAGIGFLNTAVDFSVINVTGITAGARLSYVNTIAFSVAVIHSYFWNKFWAFGQANSSLRTFIGQLFASGALGAGVIAAVIFGAGKGYGWYYFLATLIVLVVGEVVLWFAFNLQKGLQAHGTEFSLFLIVSVIGIFINSLVVGLVTGLIAVPFGITAQLWANMAKVGATLVALLWNFAGYKFFVFKK